MSSDSVEYRFDMFVVELMVFIIWKYSKLELISAVFHKA